MSNGGIIGPRNPSSYVAASGIWTMNEAQQAKGSALWPSGVHPNTVLILNGQAATDTGPLAKSVTNNGVTIPGTAKYGAGAYYFDNTADNLAISNSSDTDLMLGYGDFTIDFWINFTADGHIFYTGGAGSDVIISTLSSGLGVGSNGKICTYPLGMASTTTVTGAGWKHIEINRIGYTVRLFVDGTQEATASCVTNFGLGGTPKLGAGYHNASTNGYIDEFRIIKGVGLHSSAFTPPAAGY